MTDMTDTIEDRLRDYNTAGNPGSGTYNPGIADLRDDILVPMALFEHCGTAAVTSFNLAATTAAALEAIGLGDVDDVTFGSLTITELTVDTNVLVVDATNNRVGVGTATPSVGLEVALASKFTQNVDMDADLNVDGGMVVNTDVLVVDDSNDRVGVNTASPDVAFHVVGAQLLEADESVLPALNVVQAGTGPVFRAAQAVTDVTPGILIDDENNVTFNHDTPETDGRGLVPIVQINGIVDDNAALGVFQWGGAGGSGAAISLNRSRGSIGASTIVGADDVLGEISFSGCDGTSGPDFSEAGKFTCEVDGTPGTNDMPGRFVWYLSPDGSDTVAEVLRLDRNGLLSFGGVTDTGIQADGADGIKIMIGGSEAMRVDTDSKVLIGTDTPAYGWSGLPGFQLMGSDFNSPAHMMIHRISNDSAGAYLSLQKSKGTPGSETEIDATNTLLGSIAFVGLSSDDTYYRGALIQAEADDAWAGANTPARLRFYTATSAGALTERLRIQPDGVVYPGVDNVATFGTGSRRWTVVYATTGTINTSDATEKTAVEPLSNQELNASRSILDAIGRFKWLDAVAAKGDAARKHVGSTAQAVHSAMVAAGLNPAEYALWCQDPVVDENENFVKMRQSLRTEQVLLMLVAGLHARVSALEAN